MDVHEELLIKNPFNLKGYTVFSFSKGNHLFSE